MSNNRNRSRRGPRPTADAAKAAVPGAAGTYSFVHNGKAYALPPAAECAPKVEAGILIDAVMDGGDMAELKLGLAMLLAADIPAETLKTLRSLPTVDFTRHLAAWMKQTGVRPGESVSSSS